MPNETLGTSLFYFDADATNPVVVPNPSDPSVLVQLPAQSLGANTTFVSQNNTIFISFKIMNVVNGSFAYIKTLKTP